MGQINKQIAAVTERIIKRSASLRSDYLRQLEEDFNNRPERGKLSCGNWLMDLLPVVKMIKIACV